MIISIISSGLQVFNSPRRLSHSQTRQLSVFERGKPFSLLYFRGYITRLSPYGRPQSYSYKLEQVSNVCRYRTHQLSGLERGKPLSNSAQPLWEAPVLLAHIRVRYNVCKYQTHQLSVLERGKPLSNSADPLWQAPTSEIQQKSYSVTNTLAFVKV